MVADAEEMGVVVVPKERVEEVVKLCAERTAKDEKVMESVRAGEKVLDAYVKYERQ